VVSAVIAVDPPLRSTRDPATMKAVPLGDGHDRNLAEGRLDHDHP
jgi:hypothetical protein